MSDVLGMKPDRRFRHVLRWGIDYYGIEGCRDRKWGAGGLGDVRRFMDVVRGGGGSRGLAVESIDGSSHK